MDYNLPYQHPLEKENLSIINIKATTVKDILEILKTSKSTGPDGINPLILKKTAEAIAPTLTKLFNYSLRTSEFPSTWKTAQVTPLFKSGDPSSTKNYRPISILNILSKVFERVVFNEIYNFLRKNNKLSHLQAAYTPGSSTENQLLEIYNTVCKNMEH